MTIACSGTPTARVAAVILDMDGLMLDTESIYKLAWQNAATDCGYDLDDEFYLTLVGQPNPACEAALLNRFGNQFPLEEFRSRWAESWRGHVETKGIPTKPGLTELLSFLREFQLPVAVATSSDQHYVSSSLRAAKLEGWFDNIITGEQVVNGKPAPDIYIEAARRLGVGAGNCVALEDSDNGVLAATAAGMITVMVPDLKPPSLRVREAAFRVVGSLIEARDVIESLI